jgi:hypothetical protein
VAAASPQIPPTPDPPPPPLGDPLCTLGVLASIAALLSVPLLLAVMALPGRDAAARMAPYQVAVGLCFSLFCWIVLPSRPTNAFYLRTFRRDEETGPVRLAIRRGLGGDFRLSGIRDPYRRIPTFLKYANTAIFCLRYSTPKYMDLEAGDDWFARLWRSLADARCAFVDLADVTRYVDQEIELVYRCLGPERVLFLGDGSRDAEGWKDVVAGKLGLDGEARGRLEVAVVGDDADRLADRVRAFARGLPPGTAGLRPEAFPLVRDATMSRSGRVNTDVARTLQTVAGLGLPIALALLASLYPDGTIAAVALAGLFVGAYLLQSFATYFVECGDLPSRCMATAFGGAMLLIFAGMVKAGLAPIAQAREGAKMAICRNNLKQIGLALQLYADCNGAFPSPVVRGPKGRPLYSWRVLILPYLDQEALYGAFKLDEPWDSPNNRRLAGHGSRVFRCLSDPGAEGTTSYLAVVGPGSAFAAGGRGRALPSPWFSETPSIVEVAGARVVWSEPRELDAAQLAELIRAGHRDHPHGGIHGWFFPGEVKLLGPPSPDSDRSGSGRLFP